MKLLALIHIAIFTTEFCQVMAAIITKDDVLESYVVRFRSLNQKKREEHHAWLKRDVLSGSESSEENSVKGHFHFDNNLSGYHGKFTRRQIEKIARSEDVAYADKEQTNEIDHNLNLEKRSFVNRVQASELQTSSGVSTVYPNIKNPIPASSSISSKKRSIENSEEPENKDAENLPSLESKPADKSSSSFSEKPQFIRDALSVASTIKRAAHGAAEEDEQIQTNSPWGLATISHKAPGHQQDYVYRTTKNNDVLVYVLDTGCYPDHEDYKDRFRNNAADTDLGDQDDIPHGTGICGIIAGRKFGVAKDAQLISVKMTNTKLAGESDMIKGLNWIRDDYRKPENKNKRAVVNLSHSPVSSQTFIDAFKAVQDEGMPIVLSAGNDHTDKCALFNTVAGELTVIAGSISPNYTKADSSNYGECVNVFAPGENITSAGTLGPGSIGYYHGTSFATPHVTGLIAYFWGQDGSLNATTVVRKAIHGIKNLVKDPGSGSHNILAYNGEA